MSENEKISGLRVVVYGDPAVKTVSVKNGNNAGQQKKVLEIRAYHPNAERNQDGTYTKKDSDWYTLKLWDEKADDIQKMLKDGMALRICGSLTHRTFKDKNGVDKAAKDINLYSLAVDLKQPGLHIDFSKPAKKEE